MTFFEWRFVRGSFVAVAVALALMMTVLLLAAHASTPAGIAPGAKLSVAPGLALGGFVAAVYASVLSSAFCRANVLGDLLFTRPGSRVRAAAGIVGIDLGAIAAIWLLAFLLVGIVPLAFSPNVGPAALAFDGVARLAAVRIAATLVAVYGLGVGISFGVKAKSTALPPSGWALVVVSLVIGFAGTLPLMIAARAELGAIGPHRAAIRAAFAQAFDLHPFALPDPTAATAVAFIVGFAGIAIATTRWGGVRS